MTMVGEAENFWWSMGRTPRLEESGKASQKH